MPPLPAHRVDRRGGRARRDGHLPPRRRRLPGGRGIEHRLATCPQPPAIHPRAHRVAGHAQARRGAHDVPAGRLESSQDLLALASRGRPGGRRGGPIAPEHQLQVGGPHLGAIHQEGEPLHDVAQLAHVAGPPAARDQRPRVGGEGLGRDVVLAAGALEEALGEQHRVARALPQRGKADGQHREPMVEVLPEAPLADRHLEVGVGGADDPAVERFLGGAAQAPCRLLLERGEHLRLDVRGEEPDLVEEEHAAGRGLEQPGFGPAGVGERAPLEAEQLALQQGLGDRRAVEVDEGAAGPGAEPVEQPRHQPLAGAGLAQDKDGRQPATVPGEPEEAAQVAAHRHDRRALSDQLLEVGHVTGSLREGPVRHHHG